MKMNSRKEFRERRHKRLRQKIVGTAERPRLSVMVSNRHLNVQFVDDEAGRTLVAVSTPHKGSGPSKNMEAAKRVGQQAGVLAKEKGISAVVFDRGGFRYHGRVKAIADAVREAGVSF